MFPPFFIRRLTIKEVGLICSHRTIIKKIAKGERKYQTEWALIFEDDAALNPEILEPKELVNMTLRHIDAQPDSYGFMYFGYKYGDHLNDSDSNNGCRQHNISNFSFVSVFLASTFFSFSTFKLLIFLLLCELLNETIQLNQFQHDIESFK